MGSNKEYGNSLPPSSVLKILSNLDEMILLTTDANNSETPFQLF